MSEDQQDAIIGRTLKEYQAAKKKLAALYAEAERFGNYFTAVGHALRSQHNLWLTQPPFTGSFEAAQWPTADHLIQLNGEIATAETNKKRLGALLKEAGFEQQE